MNSQNVFSRFDGYVFSLFFFSTIGPPPRSTLFPYTTLFRSPDSNPTSLTTPVPPRCTDLPVLHAAFLGKDRKSTRLNSSHGSISYAVFCLKKKKQHNDK